MTTRRKNEVQELQARVKALEKEIEDLKGENKSLKEENKTLLERALRARADYENLMKRTEQMRNEAQKYGNIQLMLALVRVYEDLERAINEGKRLRSKLGRKVISGLKMIYKNLGEILEREGLTPIEDVGATFNPNLHEAVTTIKDKSKADGAIVECIQRGYRYHDKVLIPSKVIVVKNST